MQELDALEARIIRTLLWGVGLTALLALAGGAAVSYNMGRRLGSINAAIDQIMGGELSRRLPTRGVGDELDLLAGHVNRMLTSIERSMDDVRRVSDNVAHDLRTPLTRLRNRLEVVRTEMGPGDEEAVAAAIDEADGLLQTFNALLRIARVESRQRTDGFREVDLAAIALDAAELYSPVAEARGQQLKVAVAPVPVMVGDADLLFQALANLLDNAVKYGPEGGSIRLALSAVGSTATIVVEDNGPGIPEDLRGDALRRFWRLDHSRTSPGSGLGLSLVEAVANLHAAELELADANPGLRVVLRLPIRPARA
jgi:signal transduction histidine kinase